MERTISSLQTRFCISRLPSLTQIPSGLPMLSQLWRQSNVGCCLTSGLQMQPFQLAAGLGGNRKKTPHLSKRAVLSDARVCDQDFVFRGPTAAPPLRMNDATSCRNLFQPQPIRLAAAGRSPILRARGTRKVVQHLPEVANLTPASPLLPARRASVHRSSRGPAGPRSDVPSCSPGPLRRHWSGASVVRDPARYSVRTRTYPS